MRELRTYVVVASVGLALAVPSQAPGGDWHNADRLTCSDCHTMHNSKQGQSMRYDNAPDQAPYLLRNGTSTALCQACHGGSTNQNAPNVMGPTLGDPPGGGFPADPSDPEHLGHQLSGVPVIPGGVNGPDGSEPIAMGCTTCHDPHGTTQYRNLRPSPSGRNGSPLPIVVYQGVAASGSNPGQVYTKDNVVYVSGMTEWCLDCHDRYDSDNTHFHSYNRAIATGANTDYTWWSTGLFPVRARVQTPSYQQGVAGGAVPSQGNQVFCLSCHKAHGSTFQGSMLDIGSGSDPTSLCNQCHNFSPPP